MLIVGLALGACDSTTDPGVKPSSAQITVSGTSSVPLRLIVSTDFIETFNSATGERGQVFNSADTLSLTSLPYQATVQLTDDAKIVVDLSNPSDVEATARLQVAMDSGQAPYDREAIMSLGGALRFVFSYFSPTL